MTSREIESKELSAAIPEGLETYGLMLIRLKENYGIIISFYHFLNPGNICLVFLVSCIRKQRANYDMKKIVQFSSSFFCKTETILPQQSFILALRRP